MNRRWLILTLLAGSVGCKHSYDSSAQAELSPESSADALAAAYMAHCVSTVQTETFASRVLQTRPFADMLASARDRFDAVRAQTQSATVSARPSTDPRLQRLNEAIDQATPSLAPGMPLLDYLRGLAAMHGAMIQGLDDLASGPRLRKDQLALATNIKARLTELNNILLNAEATVPTGANVSQVLNKSGYYSDEDSADNWRVGPHEDSDTDSDSSSARRASGRVR